MTGLAAAVWCGGDGRGLGDSPGGGLIGESVLAAFGLTRGADI